MPQILLWDWNSIDSVSETVMGRFNRAIFIPQAATLESDMLPLET